MGADIRMPLLNNQPPLRIIFMGTPPFSVFSLQALQDAGHQIQAVYTQPPRPAGRGHKEKKSAVHEAAEAMGLEVRTPARLKENALANLCETPCDLIVVVGYGLLLPQAVLDFAPCVNVHPSALPRWRGAAPIQYALLHGDTSLEICIMKLELGMDTGPVYLRERFEVGSHQTFGDINDTIWQRGAVLLQDVLARWPDIEPVPQVGEATYSKKLTADMRPIDWQETATTIHNQVRALSPAPGATMHIRGEVCKVLRTSVLPNQQGEPGRVLGCDAHGIVVGCAEQAVVIEALQRAGRQAMSAEAFLRGFELKVGELIS